MNFVYPNTLFPRKISTIKDACKCMIGKVFSKYLNHQIVCVSVYINIFHIMNMLKLLI